MSHLESLGLQQRMQVIEVPKDRVSIWKFENAPPCLRSYYTSDEPANWITFVPKDFYHPSLNQRLLKASPHKYETEDGDLVYFG